MDCGSLCVVTRGHIQEQAAGRTDPGRVRDHNEDRILVAMDLGLYVTADGMGGHQTGEIASAMVVASMRNFFEATREGPWEAQAEDEAMGRAASRLLTAVRKANRDVFEIASTHEQHGGMGSTVVALLVDEAQVHIAHVGDSRCYRVRDGKVEQLTRDHSLRSEALLLSPDLPQELLETLPSNVITRALGMKDTVQVDLKTVEVEPGDTYLLCSDGLSGMLDDDEILGAFELSDTLEDACELMVALANEAGGRDNISTVLVRFDDGGERVTMPVVERRPPVSIEPRRARMPSKTEDEIVVATVETFIDNPLEQLAGVLPPELLEKVERGEVVEVSKPRCRKCGFEIIEGNLFCTECGTRVEG